MKGIFRHTRTTSAREGFSLRSSVAIGLLLLIVSIPSAFAANVLRGLEYATPAPGSFRVVVSGDDVFTKVPANFSISNPPRVVVDLPETSSALPERRYTTGSSFVQSINAVESAGRTRLVINLDQERPYSLITENNQLIITVGDMPTPEQVAAAPKAGTPPVSGDPTPDSSKDKAPVVAAPAPTAAPVKASVSATPAKSSPAKSSPKITDIDFRRVAAGGGQFMMTLSSPDVTVSEEARTGKLVLEMSGITVPDKYRKTFDVTDFATPVRSVKVEPVGLAGARVTINAQGRYEFASEKAANIYKVEFKPKAVKPKVTTTKKSREKDYDGQKLSLNFQDIEVRSVLQLLADFTGLNMVVSDTVGGNITLRLKEVPWDQALDIILTTKGLTSRRYGNVVMVAPIEEVAARERLELEAEKQLVELAPLVSELIQVNYASAGDLASLLKAENNQLLSERGNVTVDERTNTLLVQDTLQQIEQVRALLADLDRPVRQVLIESRVVIANDDFARELGVRFGFNTSGSTGAGSYLVAGGKPGFVAGTAGFAPGIENPADSGQEALMVNLPSVLGGARGGALSLLLGKAGERLLQLELSAMQQEGRGEVVSSPRVITSDQQKAVIKQGIEIPYQEATSSGATNVSFKEAVLQLDVTPHITPDDRIIMDLKVTKDNPDWSREVLGVPPVDTRSVETSVLVDNGETVVLGGVFEESRLSSEEKVPFFGDLPGLGYLFRNTGTNRQKQELLIFVTPKVLKESLRLRR